jgi:hypothetical protein
MYTCKLCKSVVIDRFTKVGLLGSTCFGLVKVSRTIDSYFLEFVHQILYSSHKNLPG